MQRGWRLGGRLVAQWPCPQLSPPTRTPSSSSPGRQGMAGVHPLPFPRGSPAPPGCSLSLSPSQSSSGVAHLCTEFSTFSACVPPTWLTVAPMGPRFPPGVTPPPHETPLATPSSPPPAKRASGCRPQRPPKFRCFDVFPQKRPRFGHRRAKLQPGHAGSGWDQWGEERKPPCATPTP